MAKLIFADGRVENVQPKNKKDFKLNELKNLVKCELIEIIHTRFEGKIMVVDDEGLLNGCMFNLGASLVAGQHIVGNALVCDDAEVL